ncbi:MAG: hypothetical protein M3R24_17565 [Chloroflexota bacterium]|nr:hypothetical protein [Chloroflexota bacterium]
MTSFDLQQLVPDMLERIPEIKPAYEAIAQEYREAVEHWTTQDFQEIRTIEQLHHMSASDPSRPGMTIVMERLVTQFLVDLAVQGNGQRRLAEITAWIEDLAQSEIFDIRNLVAVSVCEPLVTTYEDHLPHILPFLGDSTKELCRMQLLSYRVSEETKKLLLPPHGQDNRQIRRSRKHK